VNPFRSLDDIGKELPPSLLIIFGATGDLTHRKLVPALYNLAVDKLLPSNFALIATARSEHTDASYGASLLESLEKYSRRKPIDVAQWEAFASRITYLQGSITEGESFAQLRERIEQIDAETGITHERIVYCATAPRFFEPIAKHLSEHKIVERSHSFSTRPSSRVIVEKPFGHDLASAKELNAALLEYLGEDQIYRIDHYLGKETVQNLLVFRFANGIFEPIWNHKYISHVEISVAETVGVGSRAGYFDQAGIIRDIVQNHVLQLLCLVALEPPVTFDADAVRDEKVKVLRAVKRLAVDEVSKRVVRGRYQSGWVAGEKVKGYLAEEDVPEKSTAETYMAMRLEIDSWRWAGVPFFLRAGKRLAKRVTDISIFFKQVPLSEKRSHSSKRTILSNPAR